MALVSQGRVKDFSSKTLMCAISQSITGDIALDHRETTADLFIFETNTGLHFCRMDKCLTHSFDDFKVDVDKRCMPYFLPPHTLFRQTLWSSRPFQYSSALALEVSLAGVNIVLDMVRSSSLRSDEPMVLLDPCCGSGTNLFVARRYIHFSTKVRITLLLYVNALV